MIFVKSTSRLITIVFITLAIGTSVFSRNPLDVNKDLEINNDNSRYDLAYCIAAHRLGQISLSVNNNGTFGSGYSASGYYDCFTGQVVPSCEYPKNSNVEYLFAGAIWIGAVVDNDTLVSEGADGWSRIGYELNPFVNMIYRTILDPDRQGYEDAISEEDYIAVYSDTSTEYATNDYFGSRPHIPLNIEVTQSSYAWSYPYTDDFVLFNYDIKNIGTQTLSEVYIGLYVDGDVGFVGMGGGDIHTDDISGFLQTAPVNYGNCQFLDTVNIAWIADNDGDFSSLGGEPALDVTGTSILRAPSETYNFSFNWWVSNASAVFDFGPRERSYVGAWPEEFRDFRTGGLGTPEGDVNKYYIMRNQEFDYDQIYTATIQPTDTFWLSPPQEIAGDLTDGFDTRYLLSFGPFEIYPGQSLPLVMAYVGGENLHTVTDNLDNLPYNPDQYYENLDFSDLANNARWASWIYDTPGLDTDGDGYSGEFVVCDNDTFYIEGDGIPDYHTTNPPQAPTFWLTPLSASIRIRWNGLQSETSIDFFSHIQDFEGYHVYLSQDGSPGSYSLVASYDIENYLKFTWILNYGWRLLDIPFTLEELRCLYGDSCNDSSFNPLNYTSENPYIHPLFQDSVFYFEAYGDNPELGVATPIQKIYPNQLYPSSLNPDSALSEELTDDGYFKYFEYELTIENLLPAECYFVNVTAFDFGYPPSGNPPLESSQTLGTQEECTMPMTLINPDPMYMLYAYTIDTLYAQVLTDQFPSGYSASDVNLSSLVINDSVLSTSAYIHPTYPQFPGDVLEINFLLRDFILSYGFLYDTTIQMYSIEGEFTDSAPFTIESEFTLIGHISGDVNIDGVVDISDLVFLVDYFFGNGPAPHPIEAADYDRNGQIDIGDIVGLVEYMF